MITVGAGHLEEKVGPDGKSHWYDPWADIYESQADDKDIIACRTEGPYGGNTVMAVIRDVRGTDRGSRGYRGRWIIHICASAIKDLPGQEEGSLLTINLLSPENSLLNTESEVFQFLSKSTTWAAEENITIDLIRWIDYTLVNALLNIRQVEDQDNGETASDYSAAIDTWALWNDCVKNKIENIGETPMASTS